MSNLMTQNSADVFDFNGLPDELLDSSTDAPSVGGVNSSVDASFSSLLYGGDLNAPSTSTATSNFSTSSSAALSSSTAASAVFHFQNGNAMTTLAPSVAGGNGNASNAQMVGPSTLTTPVVGVGLTSSSNGNNNGFGSPSLQQQHTLTLHQQQQAPPSNLQQSTNQHAALMPGGGVGGMHMGQSNQMFNQSTMSVGGASSSMANTNVLQKLLQNRVPTNQQPANNASQQMTNSMNVGGVGRPNMAQQSQQQQVMFNNMRSPVGAGLGSPQQPASVGPSGPGRGTSQQQQQQQQMMGMGYQHQQGHMSGGGPQGMPQNAIGMMPPQYQQRSQMMSQAVMQQGMIPGGPRQTMMNGPGPNQQIMCGPGPVGSQQQQPQGNGPPMVGGGRMNRQLQQQPAHHVLNTVGPGGGPHGGPQGGMAPQAVNGPSMMMQRMAHMGPGGRFMDSGPSHFQSMGLGGPQQAGPGATICLQTLDMQQQQFANNMSPQRPILPSYSGPNNNMPNNNAYANGPMAGGPPSILASPGNGPAGPMGAPPPHHGGPMNPQVGAGSQGPMGQPAGVQGSAQDPEKRKLIQQQLVLLLHAHKCQQRERDPAGGPATGPQRPECTLPHCQTMKGVLNHMTTCDEGRSCPIPHCATSRQIIAHWKSCSRTDCPVCKPLREMTDKRPDSVGGASNSSGASSFPTNDLIAAAQNFQPAGTRIPSVGPNQMELGPVLLNGSRADDARQMLGLGESGYPHAPLGGHHAPVPNLPPPELIQIAKDWHKQVTEDLRNHLVSKLVKAIFPSPDPAAMQDHRIKDLISYARKVEREMFEQANDREEYYHLLAEKIYKIQKELQEKKAKRLEQAKCLPMSANQPSSNDQSSTASHMTPNVHASFKLIDSTVPPNKTVPMEPAGRLNSGAGPGSQIHPLGVGAAQILSNNAALSSPSLNVRLDDSFSPEKHGVMRLDAVKMEQSMASVADDADGKGGKPLMASMADVKPSPMTSSLLLDGKPSTSALSSLTSRLLSSDGSKASSLPSAASTSDVKPPSSSAAASICKKVFGVEELSMALLPVWDRLQNTEESLPFQVPVDPDTLHIPDYFEIIKNPMDLSTIRDKLTSGQYKDHWDFCNDIWLMFDNAWLYNRKNSRVYKYCTRLSEIFMDEIDPVMRQAGFCCGRKLAFTPLALVCYGQTMCAIPRDAYYYCYETKAQFGVGSERYTYCKKCFEELPGDSINLGEDSSSALVHKSQFQQLKNDHIEHEPFVNCVECGRQWHQICALHIDQIWPTGFVCETCLKAKSKKRQENRFTARRLQHCKLSQHLENRVNNFLRKKEGCHGVEVIIRVLASSDKEVEVKPYVKSKFCTTGEMPQKFPYRAKAIFAFEVIDGTEVCFFGLHVQEYGDKAQQPNSRRVYIAYLDSVHFFQPKHHRTNVYHEILLGYLEYSKLLGYSMAHIWACPPSEGDDYIFHCHPVEQKIPKPKRLQDWYKKMLDRGIVERLVVDYKDIHKQALDDNLQSPAELPYFEGDYWPNVLEDCIKEMESEEAERRRELEMQQAQLNDSNGEEVDDDQDEAFPNASGKKKSAKGLKKHKNKMKSGQYKKSKKAGASGASGNHLTDKMLAAMEKHKEVFFVVRLHSVHAAAALGAVQDADQLISCELMDGRDNFLSTARERHWEFSSLRRAKWSTLALCYELHTQGQDKFTYTCNTCKNTNAQWHCTTCDDFDLCYGCYGKSTHPHKMVEQRSLLQDEVSAEASQNSRTETIQRCVLSLVHSCQCKDANCRRMTCHKMKRVVSHTKQCKRRQNGPCLVCKQLIALCCYHAKHCQEQQCPVPFCPNIRQKLAEQAAQLKKKRDREMIRRIQLMGGAAQQPQPTPQPQQSQQQSPMVVLGGQSPMMAGGGLMGHQAALTALYHSTGPQPISGAYGGPQSNANGQFGPQTGAGGSFGPQTAAGSNADGCGGFGPNGGGGGVPQNAVLAAKEVERLAAVQHQTSSSNVPCGAVSAGGLRFMQQPSGQMQNRGLPMQQQQQQMMPGGAGQVRMGGPPVGLTPYSSWDSGGSGAGAVVGQMSPRNPGMMPQQQQYHGNQRVGLQIRGPPPNVAVGPASIGPGQNKPLEMRIVEFVQALKTSKNESEKSDIMKILRTDPQLMHAFVQLSRNNQNQQNSQQPQQQQQNMAAWTGGGSGGPGGVAAPQRLYRHPSAGVGALPRQPSQQQQLQHMQFVDPTTGAVVRQGVGPAPGPVEQMYHQVVGAQQQNMYGGPGAPINFRPQGMNPQQPTQGPPGSMYPSSQAAVSFQQHRSPTSAASQAMTSSLQQTSSPMPLARSPMTSTLTNSPHVGGGSLAPGQTPQQQQSGGAPSHGMGEQDPTKFM